MSTYKLFFRAQTLPFPVGKFSDNVSPRGKARQLTRKFSDSALIKRKPGSLTRMLSDTNLIKSKPIREPSYRARRESGSSGDGRGQFEWPLSIATNKDGEVAVTDFDLHRIEFFDTKGKWLREWGREGSEDGQLMNPVGIAFDPHGNVVISDSGNKRIQVFDKNGRFLQKMGEEELARPWGVCVTSDGHIGVCDKEDIVVFTPDGQLVRRFSQGGPPGWLDDYIVHAHNKFYVSYISTHCVKVFSNDGQFLFSFGEKGEEQGQFKFPQGLAVDKNDCLLVADRDDQCVKIFTLDGDFVGQFGKEGDELGQFYSPIDVAVAPDGSVLVVEFGNKRVQLFNE